MFIKLNAVLQLKLFTYIDKSQRKDEQKAPKIRKYSYSLSLFI